MQRIRQSAFYDISAKKKERIASLLWGYFIF
jgi:hypothetical protein